MSVMINGADVNKTSFDLSVKNPDGNEEVQHRNPKDILDEIAALDAENAAVRKEIALIMDNGWLSIKEET